MFNLRPYQAQWIADIYAAWLLFRAVLGVLPTGAGKTVCFASIMHDHVGASAAVVHRKEIVGQISFALALLGVKHRVIAPPQVIKRIRKKHLKKLGKSFIDPHAQAGVISVQTLTSKSSENDRELQQWLAQITLAVFDEGHHYVKQGLWARAVELMHNAKLLFVTATPERADGLGLGAHADGFAEVMVEGPTLKWLIEQGYLCSFVYKAPKTDLDVNNIPMTASGKVNTIAMRKRIVVSHLVGDTVEQYLQFARGRRVIVFANDVATAHETAVEFNRRGIAAAAVDGTTDSGVRDNTLDDFEVGRLSGLLNVDLFDEGFDVPAVEAVLMTRITESLAKFFQMIGRALRPVYAKGYDLETQAGRLAAIAASEKPFAIIIDPVRNWERHGMPNWPRLWTLDGKVVGSRGPADTIPQRICLACTQPYERFYLACPYCHEPVPAPGGRSAPAHVDGDLFDLDVEAMAALFERMQAADMNDEAFALDMIGRNVPPIGRGVQLRKHQAGRYRRKVLHELVGWWLGMQPVGRVMAEKHRRFYHRFGVDIGNAFTLDERDTDALIERIKQRFSEDIAA